MTLSGSLYFWGKSSLFLASTNFHRFQLQSNTNYEPQFVPPSHIPNCAIFAQNRSFLQINGANGNALKFCSRMALGGDFTFGQRYLTLWWSFTSRGGYEISTGSNVAFAYVCFGMGIDMAEIPWIPCGWVASDLLDQNQSQIIRGMVTCPRIEQQQAPHLRSVTSLKGGLVPTEHTESAMTLARMMTDVRWEVQRDHDTFIISCDGIGLKYSVAGIHPPPCNWTQTSDPGQIFFGGKFVQ